MQAIDIIKPEPKTKLEAFNNWCNWFQTKMASEFHLGRQIEVNHLTNVQIMNEDGEFKCAHINVDVQPPCCNGNTASDCGCHGSFSVYCYDCFNQDMTDDEANSFIEETAS